MTNKRSILLVEDEQTLADGLKLNLELEGYKVKHVASGSSALHEFVEEHYDLIVLDVMIPEISGFDVCRKIREVSLTPILFLSAKATSNDRVTGLRLGANDYLTKPFNLEEFILRVKNLIHLYAEKPDLNTFELNEFNISFPSYTIEGPNGVIKMSKKEADLLKMLIIHDDQVVSRNDILDDIWGKDAFPSSRTIDNYIMNFRKIFEKDTKNPEHFHSVRGVGYKFTSKKGH